MFLIDTNIAIHLRDGEGSVIRRLLDLGVRPALSILSVVELEGGVVARRDLSAIRRARLDAMLAGMTVIGFDDAVVAAYRAIIGAIGYSRSRVIDYLIAATATVNDLTLVTMNGSDFRGIPGLKLEIWSAADQ